MRRASRAPPWRRRSRRRAVAAPFPGAVVLRFASSVTGCCPTSGLCQPTLARRSILRVVPSSTGATRDRARPQLEVDDPPSRVRRGTPTTPWPTSRASPGARSIRTRHLDICHEPLGRALARRVHRSPGRDAILGTARICGRPTGPRTGRRRPSRPSRHRSASSGTSKINSCTDWTPWRRVSRSWSGRPKCDVGRVDIVGRGADGATGVPHAALPIPNLALRRYRIQLTLEDAGHSEL